MNMLCTTGSTEGTERPAEAVKSLSRARLSQVFGSSSRSRALVTEWPQGGISPPLGCKTLIWSRLIGRDPSSFTRDLSRSRYGNAGSGTCERCDPSCGECAGGGEDGCLSCAAGRVYLREEGRCLLSCPLGRYHHGAGGSCQPCHASCRSCSGDARQPVRSAG